MPVDLGELGGDAWQGWHFGPWGRAKSWRLFGPRGERYEACEIREAKPLRGDVEWLRARVKFLEQRVRADAVYFTGEQLQALYAALEILAGALPRLPRARGLPRLARGA